MTGHAQLARDPEGRGSSGVISSRDAPPRASARSPGPARTASCTSATTSRSRARRCGRRAGPTALAGLRIGFLTDLHRSETVPHEISRPRGRAAHGRSGRTSIVLGGDYVTWGDRDYVEPAAEALSGLSAPAGVFAILGNHDDDHDMPAALSAHGLHRAARRAHPDPRPRRAARPRRHPLLDPPRRGHRHAAARRVAERRPARAHPDAPDRGGRARHAARASAATPTAARSSCPGSAPIAAREFPVVAGTGQRENTSIFVSRGVGTVYVPVRLNCPPEVAVLTLSPLTVA